MSANRSITNIVLVICALTITALVVRREFFYASDPPSVPARIISNWEEVLDGGHLVYGREGAPVTVVEFSDFQCGACALAADELRQLHARHPDLVAVRYRHYPLRGLHEHAYRAAIASECAAEQGAFASYYTALFGAQGDIGHVSWTDLAGRAGVPDESRFRACLQGKRVEERAIRDTSVAYHLGVRSTPTFVVNGNMLLASPTRERWDRLVALFARSSGAEATVRR